MTLAAIVERSGGIFAAGLYAGLLVIMDTVNIIVDYQTAGRITSLEWLE